MAMHEPRLDQNELVEGGKTYARARPKAQILFGTGRSFVGFWTKEKYEGENESAVDGRIPKNRDGGRSHAR